MPETAPHSSRRRRSPAPAYLAVVAGVAAVAAPASLTGMDALDAVQRAVFVAGVTWVGSHGRRAAWLAACFLVSVPAQGISMLLALIGLTVAAAATVPRRRSRTHGAVALGISLNAVLWYPPESSPAGAAIALVVAAVLIASGHPYLRTKQRRTVSGVLLAGGAIVLAALVGFGVASLQAYSSVRSGSDEARRALEAARDGDAETASRSLLVASGEFEEASAQVDGWMGYPARVVPGLAQQREAISVTVAQGVDIATAADDIVATADYARIQYEGRLDVEQVEALAGPTRRADDTLEQSAAELDEVRSGSLLPPLRDRVEAFAEEIDEARRDTALAADLLEVTPGLFGADGERRYLVIFLASAELRGAGGFVGSYAELVAVDGDVELTRSGGIRELIGAVPPGVRSISGPEDYLARYGRFNPQDFLQDTSFSPHFPSSASVIAELYPQSGGLPVDGVIGVDPKGLAALLELTGPTQVEGLDEPITAANAVDLFTRDLYLRFPDEDVQSDILADATRATFEQVISSSLPAPRRLAETLSPAARGGHLRTWSPDPDEQALFERLGADGSLEVPTGADGLSVVQQNTGNNKLDAYLHREITYRPTVDAATGELTATLEVVLENRLPSLDLPEAVVGNSRAAPVGTNVAWLTIFTPHLVTRAEVDGQAIDLGPTRERGLNAWDTPLLQIPPGGRTVLEVDLEGGVDLADGYRLALLPQPVANADRVTVDLEVANGLVSDSQQSSTMLLQDEPLQVPTRFRIDLDR